MSEDAAIRSLCCENHATIATVVERPCTKGTAACFAQNADIILRCVYVVVLLGKSERASADRIGGKWAAGCCREGCFFYLLLSVMRRRSSSARIRRRDRSPGRATGWRLTRPLHCVWVCRTNVIVPGRYRYSNMWQTEKTKTTRSGCRQPPGRRRSG